MQFGMFAKLLDGDHRFVLPDVKQRPGLRDWFNLPANIHSASSEQTDMMEGNNGPLPWDFMSPSYLGEKGYIVMDGGTAESN